MTDFTIVGLATRTDALITQFETYLIQLRDWGSGTVDGGPNNDGFYPLSNGLVTAMVPSIAKLTDAAVGPAAIAEAAAAAAQAVADEIEDSYAEIQAAVVTAQTAIDEANEAIGELTPLITDALAAAGDAEAAATAAASSATAAAGSATGAAGSATTAAGHATTAAGHATTATNKAGEAAASATTASNAATTATTQAGLADTAKTAAETARDAALAAETAAETAQAAAETAKDDAEAAVASIGTSVTDAQDAADDAVAAKTAAEAAQAAAETARNTAQTHATNAGNSATAADTSADNAAASEAAAAASATAADASADAALASETAADTSADAAAASATAAANSATAASGSATTASGHATTATTKAGEAAASAAAAATDADDADTARIAAQAAQAAAELARDEAEAIAGGDFQPSDDTLDAFAALTWTAGKQVPALTAADTLILLTVGAAGATDLIDRTAGDGRYRLQSVALTSSDVGLGNVDNTSDLNKPISTATQTALNAKLTTANNMITDAYLRDSAALSVIGRSANSSGDPADITAGTDGFVLRRSGTTLAFGTIATAGIADAAVTYAKIANGTGLSVLGRSANSTGVNADIVAGSDGHVLRRSGTTLAFGTIATAGITDGAVTLAKIANIATSRFLGRVTASSGVVEELTAAQAKTLLAIAIADVSGLQTALDGKQASLGYTAENVANKNQANGYAGLDSSGLLSTSVLPPLAITTPTVVANQAAMLALTAQIGDVAIRTDNSKSYILSTNSPGTLADWIELGGGTGGITSVAGLAGPTITSGDLKTALSLNNVLTTSSGAALLDLRNSSMNVTNKFISPSVAQSYNTPVTKSNISDTPSYDMYYDGPNFDITLAGNVTFSNTFLSGVEAGDSGYFIISNPSAYTMSWGTSWKFTSTPPTGTGTYLVTWVIGAGGNGYLATITKYT